VTGRRAPLPVGTGRRAAAALAALGIALCLCFLGSGVGLGTGLARAGTAGTSTGTTGASAGTPTGASAGGASVTVRPAQGACAVPVTPPQPIDASEQPRPGSSVPAPLPMPAQPVGGPAMGSCGTVLPPGAPPLPAGETTASWLLADLDSGAVLAAHDPHARERPASLLKVLTSLVVLRSLNLDTVVDGTQEDANTPGSRVGVGPGGQYGVRLLLTGLLLNSGNDAANALARQLGGVPATLRAMSETAARMGALDTRPTSPSGLDAPGMSSSAYDMALFFRAAMRDPTFAEIERTRQIDWPGRGDLAGFKISNDNHMLTSYPGTIGGKTGFTDDARHTRITAAERHGRRLVVVLMRGEQHPVPMDTQAARLLDWGFALPADTPPVGTLVDQAPTAPEAAATAPDRQAAPAPGDETRHRGYALATIGGGAVLGALLSWLVARRRPPGRHTRASADARLPD
jgi:D-alanyl-D-alanine carboxypeptidase (penicillin-binding protein 5/6)